MQNPNRRVTPALRAVLRAMLNDDRPRAHSAPDIAELADCPYTTALDILRRLTGDQLVDAGSENRKTPLSLTARPVAVYTLNAAGVDYARTVLHGAQPGGDPDGR